MCSIFAVLPDIQTILAVCSHNLIKLAVVTVF